MSMYYSDAARESEPTALPNVEVFYVSNQSELFDRDDTGAQPCPEVGYYYWYCFPGCLPDSEPFGPFETEDEALQDAREHAEGD